ncbi:MAG TPA: nucleotide sugar dehydrogenase [Steroidobacteraceae bacterium]|nr:nucleotide sugar dehydrogenase [Steroidobacteraceae bacterium]
MSSTDRKISIIGGCGHVGLPLAVTLAAKGCDVTIVDIDANAVAAVNAGKVGFVERGAEELLRRHIGGNLRATTESEGVVGTDVVICVVGTPIDEHLNPQVNKLRLVVEQLRGYLRAGQLFVLRSTVFPGATQHFARWLEDRIPGMDLAFCPERVAQGYAVEEIGSLPQIVSGVTPRALARARALFELVAAEIVELSTTEAELGKLFCNAWRYISFGVANQFYSLCADNNIDYARVHAAICKDYPRMRGLPGAGLAAGPCLFKDTMQLAAYYQNNFSLGQAAMLVNEGLPRLLVAQMRRLGLATKTVGILGMAFKGDNDDTRESLAFKLKKLLELECRRVLCTDPLVKGDWLLPLEQVLDEADALIVGAPHSRYRDLRPRQPVLDPWNLLGRGGLLA